MQATYAKQNRIREVINLYLFKCGRRLRVENFDRMTTVSGGVSELREREKGQEKQSRRKGEERGRERWSFN